MTAPGDYPAQDLRDSSGRLRRIVLALLLGGAAGAIGYFIAMSLAKPDQDARNGIYTAGHIERGYQFVYYVAGLAFIVVFLAALAIQKKLADKAYVKSLSPQARVHKN